MAKAVLIISESENESDCEILEPEVILIEIDDDNDNDNDHDRVSVVNNDADIHPDYSSSDSYNNVDVDALGLGPAPPPPLFHNTDCNIEKNAVHDETTTILNSEQLNQTLTSTSSCNERESLNETHNQENLLVNAVFRISFSTDYHFFNLKDRIISSLNLTLKANDVRIDIIEDMYFFNIFGVERERTIQNKTKSITPLNIPCRKRLPFSQGREPNFNRSEIARRNCRRNQNRFSFIKKENLNCYNCNGNHYYKDCSLPRNSRKISQHIKKFNSLNSKQKFGHISPGKLSSNLKNALNLTDGETPSFFYRMRVLGYPPGWLEAAKETNDIYLPDTYEQSVIGLLDEQRESDKNKHYYDEKKIVTFPGFNVHPGEGYFDDYERHGVPPIDVMQSITRFIQNLKKE